MANYYQNFELAMNEASTSSGTRSCKLVFSTGFASSVYTGQKISGKARSDGGNDYIGVLLVDRQTDQLVIDGPVASAKVKIVLLGGDFGRVWTPSEFKKSIITVWKKKKNILLGDLSLALTHGRGTVGEIRIKHDGKYFSKATFRLGAMVVDCSYEVQEAISDPFEVKDRRNESNSTKNGSVSPTDKVSKLKNIGKKGRKRLECANIITVKDFLDKLYSDSQDLQEISGSKGKRWEETVRHAKTCNIFHKRYCNIADEPVGSIEEFDYNCYKPPPYENNLFDNTMIPCHNDLSTQDYPECEMLCQPENHGLEPQEDGVYGVSTTVSYGSCGVEGVMKPENHGLEPFQEDGIYGASTMGYSGGVEGVVEPENHGLEPCLAYQEDGVYGVSTTVSYGSYGVEGVMQPENHGLEPFQEDGIYGASTMGYSGRVEGVVEPENHVIEPFQEDGTYDASSMVGYGGGVEGVMEPENHGLEPWHACQEDGIYGPSTRVGYGEGVQGVIAKKRWMKLRSIWFLMVSFIVKRVCVSP